MQTSKFPYHYFAYGLHIGSEIACPGLTPYEPTNSEPDVRIRLGKTPNALIEPLGQGVLYQAKPNHYLLNIDGVASYYVSNGNQIVVAPASQNEPSQVSLFLLHSPISALLYQRSIFSLHASAIETDRGAVLFASASGVGKSTTAAALAQRGYRILNDEFCPILLDSQKVPVIWPGACETLLWRDALEKLGCAQSSTQKVRSSLEKYRYCLHQARRDQASVPISRIYILSVRNSRDLQLEPIRGQRKVQAMREQLYNEPLIEALDLERASFLQLAQIASQIESNNVAHPRDHTSLIELIDLIEADFPGGPVQPSATAHRTSTPSADVDTRLDMKPSSSKDNIQPPNLPVHSASAYLPNQIKLLERGKKNIVWLASYPKSGNTWLRAFLANYLSAHNGPMNINELAHDPRTGMIASQRKLFDDKVGIEASYLTHDEIDRYRPSVYTLLSQRISEATSDTCFVKIHDALTMIHDNQPLVPQTATKGVIYIVRNPLDVAISYAYHSDISIDESIQVINYPEYGLALNKKQLQRQLRQKLGNWSGHVRSWIEQDLYPVHVIRYEDMKQKSLDTFQSVIHFAGLPTNTERVRQALRWSSLEELQRQEKTDGFQENPTTVSSFFRKGETNGWRKTLSSQQVAKIVDAHEDMMRKFGYLEESS